MLGVASFSEFDVGYTMYKPQNLYHFMGKCKNIDVTIIKKVICGDFAPLDELGDFTALTTIVLPSKFNEPLDKYV